MKKIFTPIIFFFFIANIFAQSPEKMSYQAVIRNADNNLVTDQEIGIQISILQGAVNGNTVYVENLIERTNSNGLLSIEIGTGSTTDNFSEIDWGRGSFFIKTEMDPQGGTNFSITGITQLVSVAYALHAKTAETIVEGLVESDPLYRSSPASSISIENTNSWADDQNETDPEFTASRAANISASHINNLNLVRGVNTGDQDLSGINRNTSLIQESENQLRSEFPDVSNLASASNVLSLNNTTEYTPTRPYHPATKKYVTDESDPVYNSSPASKITESNIDRWNRLLNNNYEETDSVYANSPSANISSEDIQDLNNLSGLNTGDQDISGIAENRIAIEDTINQLLSELPDINLFVRENQVLKRDNATKYTPNNPYHPATKQYVDAVSNELNDSINALIDETEEQIRNEIPILSNFAEKNNVLERDNTTEYTPTEDYHPATKKHVSFYQRRYETNKDEAENLKAYFIEKHGLPDSLAKKNNVLELDNTTEYSPTEAYHPATKKYADDLKDRIESTKLFIQLRNNKPLEELIAEGVSHSQLIKAELRRVLFEARQNNEEGIITLTLLNSYEFDAPGLLTNGVSIRHFEDNGISLADLLNLESVTLQQLFGAGFRKEDFQAQGYSTNTIVQRLIDEEGVDVNQWIFRYRMTIRELYEGGVTIQQLLEKSVITIPLLLEEGITIQQLLEISIITIPLLLEERITIQQLLDGGVSRESLYGLTYQGGILFYIDMSDELAYVISAENEVRLPWDPNPNPVFVGTEQGIGYGKSNTEKIVTALGEGSYAAKYCYDLENDYDDWFLPSIDELREFTHTEVFMSSSELDNTFLTTGNFAYDKYLTNIKVRAVRSFALTDRINPETN